MTQQQELPVSEFTLVFSPAETNFILAALGDRPFKESAPLIQKIQNVCRTQIQAAEQAKHAPVEPEVMPA